MTWIPWLAAAAPLAYLAAAIAPERAFPILRTSRLAGWASLGGAALGLWQSAFIGAARTPLAGLAGLGLAERIDLLSAVFCGLIAFIGLIVVAYSRNYLDGDRRQGRFVRDLCLTLGFVQGLALSDNLAQLVLCWIGVGVCVNRLLLFRAERQAAVLAARKRFLVSRLAEACLVAACVCLWRATGGADIGAILASAHGARVADWGAAPLLLAMAAILSSAQVPVHGWILEVMETPTPVSALLHAGVVNAGGFLLLRFGAVMVNSPGAMGLLTLIGALTAIFGSLAMLPQTSVKVRLAYSTIAQMGFMVLECGLGAFGAALLHIVAHALYKAHAFLTAGTIARAKPQFVVPRAAPFLTTLALPATVALGAWAATALGVGPTQQPGAFLLGGVLFLGLARIWLSRDAARAPAVIVAGSLLVVVAFAAGHVLFAGIVDARAVQPTGPTTAVAGLVLGLMTALVCVQLHLPGPAHSRLWASAYTLASNGFYLNTMANRWVLRLWPTPHLNPTQTGAVP